MKINNGFLVTTESSIEVYCGVCYSRIRELRINNDNDLVVTCGSCAAGYSQQDNENQELQAEIEQLQDVVARLRHDIEVSLLTRH